MSNKPPMAEREYMGRKLGQVCACGEMWGLHERGAPHPCPQSGCHGFRPASDDEEAAAVYACEAPERCHAMAGRVAHRFMVGRVVRVGPQADARLDLLVRDYLARVVRLDGEMAEVDTDGVDTPQSVTFRAMVPISTLTLEH